MSKELHSPHFEPLLKAPGRMTKILEPVLSLLEPCARCKAQLELKKSSSHTLSGRLILWFLSANRSQQDLILDDPDDCFKECDDNFGDDATDTGNLGLLTLSDEGMRIKFLNGLAELLSPAKGWNYVSATALRESEDEVEVDLVRNGGFSNKESHESQADAGYIAALRHFIGIHDNEGISTLINLV